MKQESIERIVDLAATLASRADEFDQVLVLYRRKDEEELATFGSMDNEMTLKDTLWMIEAFKAWLVLASFGILPRKDAVE